MKTALTIAGSDSCGGAGIQADIKTMTCNGIYAMSAITALTAQNTTGVSGISEVTPEFLEQQITAVVTDIKPDAVKTGMIPSSQQIEVIASCIKKYDLKNIVVDPVMVATSGSPLLEKSAERALTERKTNALRRGEIAGTKMLFPMILMLGVVLVTVAAPAFLAF